MSEQPEIEAAEWEIERLFPDPGPTTVADQLSDYNPVEWAHEDRPYLAMNFAATLDGRAAIDGRSGPIGSKIDSAMLLRLRTRFDAVMIGAGTMRAERYGRIVRNPQLRAWRERVGLPHDPLAVIVTGGLDLPWDAPLFTSGQGRILILTSSEASPPQTATRLRTVRLPAVGQPDGEGRGGIDVLAALRHLRRERGVRALLCEGGPHLHGELQAAGAVDELFLTLGPCLTGGAAPRITEGPGFPLRDARLGWLLRHGDELLARYTL
jgi:riboflavin-specific deaminase-like protein